jgi:hypothetical protein
LAGTYALGSESLERRLQNATRHKGLQRPRSGRDPDHKPADGPCCFGSSGDSGDHSAPRSWRHIRADWLKTFTAKTRRNPGSGEKQQQQGNTNNTDIHRCSQQFRSETDPAEGSATRNLRDVRVLRGKNEHPRLVDGPVSGGQALLFTTEDTEVTEALGSLASHSACLRIRYTHFLVYEIQRFVARFLAHSHGTDRNGLQREALFRRVFAVNVFHQPARTVGLGSRHRLPGAREEPEKPGRRRTRRQAQKDAEKRQQPLQFLRPSASSARSASPCC